MQITFKNTSNIAVKYFDAIPAPETIVKAEDKYYKTKQASLYFYFLYRNSIYNSYKNNPDVAEDIKNFNQKAAEGKLIVSPDPIFNYSATAALGAMQEWQSSKLNVHCYIAYETTSHTPIGFVQFHEAAVNNKPVVYIAQMGVKEQSKGIGTQLMQCVLAHYEPNTEFYVLTRVFNHPAKKVYGEKLAFEAISEEEVKQLGYDQRYCGFHHITTPQEIAKIKQNLIQEGEQPSLRPSL